MPNQLLEELSDPLDIFGNQREIYCECCAPRYSTMTVTANAYKWTREEVEETILKLANDLRTAPWYRRGDIRRAMNHWTEKLSKLNEVEEGFNVKSF